MPPKVNGIDNLRFFTKDKEGNEIEIINYTGKDLEHLLNYLRKDIVNSIVDTIQINEDKQEMSHDKDVIRDRLPNAYNNINDQIKEVKMADGYDRFACPYCLQGIMIDINRYYIVNCDGGLYSINVTDIDLTNFYLKLDQAKDDESKYNLLKELRDDLKKVLETLSTKEKVLLAKDEDEHCECPICNTVFSIKSAIEKYEELAKENNVCDICGKGDISYVVNEKGESKIECDLCLN